MQIFVNEQPRDVEANSTLAQLVANLGMQPKYVAVERNRELVPRAKHGECVLQENDRLEIVTLVGGG